MYNIFQSIKVFIGGADSNNGQTFLTSKWESSQFESSMELMFICSKHRVLIAQYEVPFSGHDLI